MKELQWYEKNTQQDIVEDQAKQRSFKLSPIDFIDYALSRKPDRNHQRALEYFHHGRIDGKKVCTYRTWDREIYEKLKRGTYD